MHAFVVKDGHADFSLIATGEEICSHRRAEREGEHVIEAIPESQPMEDVHDSGAVRALHDPAAQEKSGAKCFVTAISSREKFAFGIQTFDQ
jgi:hypothetical protein